MRMPRLTALFHGAAERDAALELQRDVLGDQLRIEIGPAHLVDVDEGFLRRQLASSLLSFSISAPFLPMTIPGRAV
jgi:hypothetical protein